MSAHDPQWRRGGVSVINEFEATVLELPWSGALLPRRLMARVRVAPHRGGRSRRLPSQYGQPSVDLIPAERSGVHMGPYCGEVQRSRKQSASPTGLPWFVSRRVSVEIVIRARAARPAGHLLPEVLEVGPGDRLPWSRQTPAHQRLLTLAEGFAQL